MSIVKLPCETGQHRAVFFDVFRVYQDRVFLVDLCADWNGYASVVDAAHEVLQYCNTMYGTTRVICDDARERWQEIVPKKGAFDISPYQDDVPFMVEVKCLLARQQRPRPWRWHKARRFVAVLFARP
jgi:hypothetical protein